MKVGWLLIGGRAIASSRQIGYMTHDWLNSNTSIESTIINNPGDYNPTINVPLEDLMRYDIVIFQKVCLGNAPELIDRCRDNGIKTVYIIDDLIAEGFSMCSKADYIISGDASIYLADQIKRICHKEAFCMPNPIETPIDLYKEDYTPNSPLKVLWFGTECHIHEAWIIKPLLDALNYTFEVVSSGPSATKLWTPNCPRDDIKNADIIVMPFLGELPPYELAKGANRAQQAMALGLPIIASPYPSYMRLIQQGKTGFICLNNTEDDWYTYLKLLGSQELREKVGKAARRSVINKYSMGAVGNFWKDYLEGL